MLFSRNRIYPLTVTVLILLSTRSKNPQGKNYTTPSSLLRENIWRTRLGIVRVDKPAELRLRTYSVRALPAGQRSMSLPLSLVLSLSASAHEEEGVSPGYGRHGNVAR